MRLTALLLLSALFCFGQNPNTARFPGAIATDNDLYVADNNNANPPQLTLPIGSGDTTFNVTATTGFTTPTIITLETEYVAVCSKTSTTFTVCSGGRGFNGSTATSHAIGVTIFEYIMAWERNQDAAEIKAIESALGVSLANVQSVLTFQGNGSKVQKTTGSFTLGNGLIYDINGNIIDAGSPPQLTTTTPKTPGDCAAYDISGRTIDVGFPCGGGGSGGSEGTVQVTTFNYAALSCDNTNTCFAGDTTGASLTAVPTTLTLTPCPLGILNGSIWAPIYISGGTGTAEVITPSSGTCTSGAVTGTVVFTPANSHSGAFTLTSATVGWQEAANSAGANASIYFPCSTSAYTLQAGFNVPASGQTYFSDSPDCMSITQANGADITYLATIGSFTDTTFRNLTFNGNFINQTWPSSTFNGAIEGGSGGSTIGAIRPHIVGNIFKNFGYSNVTYANYTIVIQITGATNNPQGVEIRDNHFWSIQGFEGQINNTANPVVTGNISGTASLKESNTPTAAWDTHAAGMGWQMTRDTNPVFSNNKMFGPFRDPTFTFQGVILLAQEWNTAIASYQSQPAGGFITNNYASGLANGYGTIAVTNGSGTITGTGTSFFCTGSPAHDLNAVFVIEGDTTAYKITTCTSTTSLVVTPVVARATASGLRYQTQQSGDMFYIESSSHLLIADNTAVLSGDMGMDVATTATSPTGTSSYNQVLNNHFEFNMVCGLYMGGANYSNQIEGNFFHNNATRNVTGFNGAICFQANDGTATVRTPQLNYFSSNYAFDDRGTPPQTYLMETDGATNSASFSDNIIGPGNFVYTSTSLPQGMFDPSTAVLLSQMFPFSTYSGSEIHSPMTFAKLALVVAGGTTPNGLGPIYCPDCNIANPCTGGGTGAFAKRLNSVWVCN